MKITLDFHTLDHDAETVLVEWLQGLIDRKSADETSEQAGPLRYVRAMVVDREPSDHPPVTGPFAHLTDIAKAREMLAAQSEVVSRMGQQATKAMAQNGPARETHCARAGDRDPAGVAPALHAGAQRDGASRA